MRIAINTRFLLKNKLEGFGWFTFEVLQRLCVQHPEHEFYFFFDRPFDPSFVFSPNITPVVLYPPARHPFLFIAWFEWAVPRALKQYQIDVFFSTDNFCSLGSKVPTVLVIHDLAYLHFPEYIPWLVKQYYRYFMPRFAKRAEQIITVSEYTKQDIISHFNIPAKKITVCYNGCRSEFQPLSESQQVEVRQQYSKGNPYFFYVGAVHPRKNVPRLIAAFDAFKKNDKNNVKLLIGGRFAWQTGDVKAAFEQSSCQEDIVFLGYVPDDALPLLCAASLALVYVSLFEGFGIPLLEAMRCEVAIITSNVSSMPEVVGDAALKVNPKNINEIADAMKNIYKNDGLRLSLIEKGKIRAQQFSWDKAVQIVEKVLFAL